MTEEVKIKNMKHCHESPRVRVCNKVKVRGRVKVTNDADDPVPVVVLSGVVSVVDPPLNVISDSGSVTSVSGDIVSVVNASGTCLCVTISGITVSLSGAVINTNISGQPVSVSGNIVQISGQDVFLNSGSVTSVINASGQGPLVVTVSGQPVVITSSVTLTSQVVIMGALAIPANQDGVTNAITQLTHPHQEIHDGTSYVVSDIQTGVGAATFKPYLVVTSTHLPHMLLGIQSAPGCIIRWKESPTVSSNGTPLATINHNRNSGITAVTSVFVDPVYTSGTGTQLYVEEIGSTTTAGTLLGNTSEERNEREWNLKMSGAMYLLEILTLAANTDMSTAFRWYEP